MATCPKCGREKWTAGRGTLDQCMDSGGRSCVVVARALAADRARIAQAIREEQKLAPLLCFAALDRLLRVVEGG